MRTLVDCSLHRRLTQHSVFPTPLAPVTRVGPQLLFTNLNISSEQWCRPEQTRQHCMELHSELSKCLYVTTITALKLTCFCCLTRFVDQQCVSGERETVHF